tara:strand:+ start:2953 stop:4347 length:1395 start_codon:yes stop_codon:yes gene_type:complete
MIKKQNIHFIGIGGIGMSAIADILNKQGFQISGSDINQNQITKQLEKKGIKIFKGHKAKNINEANIVVFSSAIDKSNVEIVSARKKKIRLYSRAMMLAEVMRLKSSITVAGSHGKTTTTSLVSTILESAGFDPTIINGGIINSLNANAKLGKGKWIVAEADESDGTFMKLPSTIGAINNIDLEHLDFYSDINEIKRSFIEYANKIPFYGFLVINIDDKNVRDIKAKIKKKQIYTYGFSKKSNYYAQNLTIIKKSKSFYSKFEIVSNFEKKKTLKNVLIPLIGSHNILNTLCAYAIARGLSISNTKILSALKVFKGVKRRFSIIFNDQKNIIIDDYAHHPNEIDVTLNSLKSITRRKLITIFEPHRISRLKGLEKEFIKCFAKADVIFILPIYTAGEKIDLKYDYKFFSCLLKKKYKNKVIYPVKNNISFFEMLTEMIEYEDNIIFLGAGQSSKIASEFSKYFAK